MAAQQGGRAGGKGSAANTRTRTVVNSHFDNHATAATMNELIESLQEVKRIIECEDPVGCHAFSNSCLVVNIPSCFRKAYRREIESRN